MDSVEDELPTEVARLRNEIACALYDQLPIRNETIEQEDVPEVAYALARRLLVAYRLERIPGPDEADDADEVSLDAATFYGSALSPASRYPIFDWEGR